jgi:ribosomal protein L11 methyltransferase
MLFFCFTLHPHTELPEWVESRTDCFALEQPDGSTSLYLPLTSPTEAEQLLSANPSFVSFEPVELKDYIDWGVQWSTHSPDFQDYRLEIDLSKYTGTLETYPHLYLEAGPGFGDLSHPTTRLTLAMIGPHVKGKQVIDIGCGSGILTLAALLLGAKTAFGLDIDPEALSHAVTNARLNHLENKAHFEKPEKFEFTLSENPVILMNMIRTEQQQAWASLPSLHPLKATWITSGILIAERDLYLDECLKRGWTLIEERQEGDWMAFKWHHQPSSSS